MIDWRLRRHLDKAARRLRYSQLLWQATFVWLLFASVGGLVWWLSRTAGLSFPGRHLGLILFAFAAWAAVSILSWRRTRDYRFVANRVESQFPDLETGLLAALDVPSV